MKVILSVILASMILFLSAGFRVATHYCGDVAVTTSLTTDGVAEGCGMEKQADSGCDSESPEISKTNCCKDAVMNLEIEDDYQNSDKSTNLDIQFVEAFIYVYIQNLFEGYEEAQFNEYSPPLVLNDILVENQVFLI